MKIENLEKAHKIREQLSRVHEWDKELKNIKNRADQDSTGDWVVVEVARERVCLPLASFKGPIRAFLTLAMDDVAGLKKSLVEEVAGL